MSRIIVPAAVTLLGIAVAFAFLRPGARPLPAPTSVPTERVRVHLVTMTNALAQPWALAFLPDGDILVTERGGRLRLIHEGRLSSGSIGGMPPVDTRAQDGLMDLALDPRFTENRTIYFTYSKPGGDRGDTTALASGRFDGTIVSGVRDLFVAEAWSTAGGNSGSRIAFGLDGTIYMSVGDRHEQKPAQDLRTDKGKILRLNQDGTVPADNPFVGRADARPEIFAYGVRNPQGLFVDRSTGTIWEHEHGPRGGDELNVIVRGHNYGWPVVTFGINYNGTTISKYTERPGMDSPVAHWTPSISPSGLTRYFGDRFPAWNGDVFLGALSGMNLRRLEVRDGQVTHEETIQVTPHSERIRDVRQGPDGLLYVLTDGHALLRLEPAG